MVKEFITYDEYGKLLNELVIKIKNNIDLKTIKMIYTFMRGGLPIAVHLSHFLEIPTIYTNETKFDFTAIPYNTVLIVDDVADTGKTLDGFHILFPTATLFYKPLKSKIKPTFFVRETDSWIIYPWEKENETPNR